MDIYLIRHGECDLNRRYIGSGTDIPLLEQGKREIKTLTQNLMEEGIPQNVTIYTSTLLRSVESCNIFCEITGNTNIIKDERLNEIGFGIFENLTYDEIMLSHKEVATKWYDDVYSNTPDGGEPFQDFVTRVKSFWNKIIEKSSNESTTIIFTHGGVIQLLRCFYHHDTVENRWLYYIDRGTYIKISV